MASGIGFLVSGVILREGLNVRGMNTAATLWCSAAIGTLEDLISRVNIEPDILSVRWERLRSRDGLHRLV